MEEKFEEIRKRKSKYNQQLNDGATDSELKKFNIQSQKSLGYFFPDDYLMMLQMINGIEYNGFILYGIDEYLLERKSKQRITGAIHTNQEWYELEENKSYIFLAEDELSWYVLDEKKDAYRIMSKPTGDYLEEYNDFETLLDRMLGDALL